MKLPKSIIAILSLSLLAFMAGGIFTVSVFAAPSLVSRLAGRFLLAVEDKGKIWYVDPVSLKRELVDGPKGCWELAKRKKLGINNRDLKQISAQDDSNALIKITSPQPNDTISSPAVIEGQARGNWFFEGSFPIKIFDADDQELATGLANAQDEWMTTDFVPFKAKIEFKPTTETGAIVLIKDNPSGKKKFDDQLSIPIKFALPIKIYFIDTQKAEISDCSATKEFIRTIPYTQSIGTAAINEMLKGPTDSEAETASNNIPKNTKLLSLNIEKDVAYADFSQEMQNYYGGSCNVSAIRAQIESTLKQFNTINYVVISIEGKTENILQP